MALEDKLYLIGSKLVAGYITGCVWTWDGTDLVEIKDFTVDGKETPLAGGVLFSEDECLYCCGHYYDGANTYTGVVWKFDGTDWTIEFHDTATSSWFTDIVEFNGALFGIKRNAATAASEVWKRSAPGEWAMVLDTGGTNAAVGGLIVITGLHDVQYLIAWPYAVWTGNRFFYSEDGEGWNGGGSIFGNGWASLSYIFWDDDNEVFRACCTTQVNEYTCGTINGSWAAGDAHGHTSDYIAWCDHLKLATLDVLISPRVTTQARKWDGSSWSNEFQYHASDWVDVTKWDRQTWANWNDAPHSCARVGSYVKLYKLDGSWSLIHTLDINTRITDLVIGPTAPPPPVPSTPTSKTLTTKTAYCQLGIIKYRRGRGR